MDLLSQIVARAKSDKQRIVLPEATEERTLRAADKALGDDIADIILLGNPDEINKLAAEWGLANIGKAKSNTSIVPGIKRRALNSIYHNTLPHCLLQSQYIINRS